LNQKYYTNRIGRDIDIEPNWFATLIRSEIGNGESTLLWNELWEGYQPISFDFLNCAYLLQTDAIPSRRSVCKWETHRKLLSQLFSSVATHNVLFVLAAISTSKFSLVSIFSCYPQFDYVYIIYIKVHAILPNDFGCYIFSPI
jgi:hypothetical protein